MCTDCGIPLSHGRFKCDDCIAKTKAAARRRRKQRDRARRKGIAAEPYTLALIAQRDEYLCGICAEPVDMTLVAPDNGAPSIDHILPIAKGGNDTLANVQLAHFECNWIKGDSEWKSLTVGGRHAA